MTSPPFDYKNYEPEVLSPLFVPAGFLQDPEFAAFLARDTPIFMEDLLVPPGFVPSPIPEDPAKNFDEIVPETEFSEESQFLWEEFDGSAISLGESQPAATLGESQPAATLDPYQIWCKARLAGEFDSDYESESESDGWITPHISK